MEVTEPPTSTNEDEDDVVFFDALDDFPSTNDESDQSTSPSTLSSLPESKPSQPTHLRRRPSRRSISGDDSKTSTLESQIDSINDKRLSIRARRLKLHQNLKEPDSTRSIGDQVSSVEAPSGRTDEGSTVTTAAGDDPGGDSADSAAAQNGEASFSFLVFIAGLIIKAIGVQINVFITILTFPIWVLHHFYMLFIDPLQIVRRGREHLIEKLKTLWNLGGVYVSPRVFEWLKDQNSVWKVALRCGWGLFWSFYVGFVLCGLLVSSLVFSGVLMRCIVAEPMHMKDVLNFDYTKHSPVAYVPVMACAGAGCGADCREKVQAGKESFGGFRAIPSGHKLAVTVSFVLPESEYNRNLGVFQVRVQFLSVDGKTLASSCHPGMLHFKSEPIRLLLTFLKVVPLVAGYVSESQTLNLKFRGFMEGHVRTACLMVTIEQRAEYQPGAGIPQIYDASVTLESELPLFKRIIWNWRKTIFVWISMMLFMMEMLFTLICCRPLIIPRARPRDGSVSSSTTQRRRSVSSSTTQRPRDGSVSSSTTQGSLPV